MYKLNIKGSTREAEYDVNPETGELEQTSLNVVDPNEKNDCLSFVIVNPENRSNLEENWLVLYGKPWQIVRTIDNRYQMAKLMTNPIFDYLDTVGRDDAVALAYPTEEPSPVIGKSHIHRTMRKCAPDVLKDIFEFEELEVLGKGSNPTG